MVLLVVVVVVVGIDIRLILVLIFILIITPTLTLENNNRIPDTIVRARVQYGEEGGHVGCAPDLNQQDTRHKSEVSQNVHIYGRADQGISCCGNTYVDGESHFHGIVRVAGPFAPEVEVGEWVFGVGHCFVRQVGVGIGMDFG